MGTDTADAVAIVGMGCRFAGSDGLEEFWDNLRRGRDCATRGPAPDAAGAGLAEDEQPVAAWGLMADRYTFDAGRAGYRGTPKDDPQHGVLYETLVAAAEDASVRLSEIGGRTALFAACTPYQPLTETSFNGVADTDTRFAANHFSYFHGLHGASVMVDASCATGLTAVHLACQSLRLGSCDHALVGAVSIMPTEGWYPYRPGGIYAVDGVCRPFDTGSTGVIPGDGAAAVLLRRLDDALRDGDPIHAVIRSTAVGNDGHDKAGFVIPGVPGKIRVVRQALAEAGVDGAEIGYVEAHGVGIPLNDEIEATALTEALGPQGVPLAIGSVKAAIGHTNQAAGLAALIKTALQLEHGYLAATPNTREPIETLVKGGERYSIVPHGRTWDDAGVPRLAGVMSAGIGGTNAFAVLEQPPLAAA